MKLVYTLAVDGWAVTFGTARRDWAEQQHAKDTRRCTKCISPPIDGQRTNHRIAI